LVVSKPEAVTHPSLEFLVELAPALVWLVDIWVEANSAMVKVNNITATKATNIYVFFCILSPYYDMDIGSYGNLVKKHETALETVYNGQLTV
jgi:hypothetical protein